MTYSHKLLIVKGKMAITKRIISNCDRKKIPDVNSCEKIANNVTFYYFNMPAHV